jgi:hypothetical protein
VIALIRERQRRLAAILRYDRYIAQAAGHLTLQGFWRNLKRQDEEDAQRLKNWVDRETADGDRGPWPTASNRIESPGPEEVDRARLFRTESGRNAPHHEVSLL